MNRIIAVLIVSSLLLVGLMGCASDEKASPDYGAIRDNADKSHRDLDRETAK